jgi:catechol 2,3-dioxygenase-like lactoylglutathione lyase family enzyme
MDMRIALVSLWAEDVSATARFYRDAIGLTPLPHHPGGRPHFDLVDSTLTILKGKPIPPQDPEVARFPLIAFAVGDLEAAIQRLQDHGVELPWGIENDAAGRWVMFPDPAGNLIELVEWQAAPAARPSWPGLR